MRLDRAQLARAQSHKVNKTLGKKIEKSSLRTGKEMYFGALPQTQTFLESTEDFILHHPNFQMPEANTTWQSGPRNKNTKTGEGERGVCGWGGGGGSVAPCTDPCHKRVTIERWSPGKPVRTETDGARVI